MPDANGTETRADATQPPDRRRNVSRTIAWIVAGVAVAAAVALGVWAVLLRDDLNERSAAAASRTAQAKERGQSAMSEIEQIEGVFVVTEDDVTEAEQAAADAEAAANDARTSVEQARAERDQARAEAQQARLCARGSLDAARTLFEEDPSAEDVENAAGTVETVSDTCASTLSETP
jgi:hypothetical protein